MTLSLSKTGENKTIIFFTGKQRSGKDTAADILVEHYGFQKIALADKVKEVARDLFGMQEKDRGLLIEIGTKMREISPSVWLVQVLNHIDLTPAGSRIVIPDVRFENEWFILRDIGAIPVKIFSFVNERKKRPGYDSDYENDPTEGRLLEFPHYHVISNNSSKQDFFFKVCWLAETILGKEGRRYD